MAEFNFRSARCIDGSTGKLVSDRPQEQNGIETSKSVGGGQGPVPLLAPVGSLPHSSTIFRSSPFSARKRSCGIYWHLRASPPGAGQGVRAEVLHEGAGTAV